LRREKETEETRRRAEEYAREALAWMVKSGLATRITVTASWVQRGVLALACALYLPQNKVEQYAFNTVAGLGEVDDAV
jgi:phage gp46-like protein